LEIFVDESGDLGFGPRASLHYVIAYVIPASAHRARADIARVARRLKTSGIKIGEFKHSHDSVTARNAVFGAMASIEFAAGVVAVDKAAVKAELKGNKAVLNNFLIANYVASSVLSYEPEHVTMIMDQSMSKEAREHFDEYFKRKISYRSMQKSVVEPVVEIHHENSNNDRCIQMADYIAGACFLWFERGNRSEYSRILGKIRFTNGWGRINW
jgi:Protein of unknown function (DUF3800)